MKTTVVAVARTLLIATKLTLSVSQAPENIRHYCHYHEPRGPKLEFCISNPLITNKIMNVALVNLSMMT